MATISELRVLHPVVRGDAFRGAFCGAYGQRDIAAAQDLQKRGLLRIVMLDDRKGEKRYVAIPPNAEWDFAGNCIRKVAP